MFAKILKLVLYSAIISAAALPQVKASNTADEPNRIHTYLSSEHIGKGTTKNYTYEADLIAFYKARDFKPVWFDENGSTLRNIAVLQTAIKEQAYLNGMPPNDYEFEAIMKDGLDAQEREFMLSDEVLHYINDITSGRIEPAKFDSRIFFLETEISLPDKLAALVAADDPAQYLTTLPPPHREYEVLRESLAKYRNIATQGGWPEVIMRPETLIYPGDTHEIILLIRKRLARAYHDYDGKLPDGIWIDDSQMNFNDINGAAKQEHSENTVNVYDKELARRVVEFQYFRGKKADGIIGPETLAALKRPIEDDIRRIKLAMERWRWLPDDLGRKHIRLNIAAFYARAVKDGQDQFVMPVITGQVMHQTPVFSSVIKNVKIHPDWTSPDSIAGRYLIPKIQNDPAVIHRLGYQLQDKNTGDFISWDKVNIEYLHEINLDRYQFRQKPGVHNVLGLARFSIDNDYAIFMHGTPSTELFKKHNRTFSSGCVRVENPLVMAHFLLNDQGMSRKKLADLYYLEENEFPDTTYINLKENVPVHLLYMTAWVDQKGNLHFAEDVYGRDKDLSKALAAIHQ